MMSNAYYNVNLILKPITNNNEEVKGRNIVPSMCRMIYLNLIAYNILFFGLLELSLALRIHPFNFPPNVQEGQKIQLICGVIGAEEDVRFSWLKDGKVINSGKQWTVVAHPTVSLLFVNNASVQSNGNYTCLAKSSSGEGAHTAKLVITGPPEWKHQPHDISVKLGEDVTVPCVVYGHPKPLVQWKRNGRHHLEQGHWKIEEDGSLTIVRVSPSDGGYYTCTVTNGIGKGLQKSMQLTVKDQVEEEEDHEEICRRVGQKCVYMYLSSYILQNDTSVKLCIYKNVFICIYQVRYHEMTRQ
ncbi:cell adhesion molecule DSCAML1-like [Tachypleus tridentatus]|uniref:cell adhesion molecule DSCAML1-like n=1 Tax=Tachypleus tridentatus TaxID=6853 RepID=UPI003FCFC985